METIKDFISEGYIIDYVCKSYKSGLEYLRKLRKQKKELERRYLSEKRMYNQGKLGYADYFDLDYILQYLINENLMVVGKDKDSTIDLENLRSKLLKTNPDIKLYNYLNEQISSTSRELNRILFEYITFNNLESKIDCKLCESGHSFVYDHGALTCAFCGATTKGHEISRAGLKILIRAAKKQGSLIEYGTEKDLPFIKVLKEEYDLRVSKRKELDVSDEVDLTLVEEYLLEDEYFIKNVKRQVELAHMLDSPDCCDINTKYLSDEDTEMLLDEIERKLEIAKKMDSRFRNLLIEECRTARYEVLILSGTHIPSLSEYASDEDEKIALTKAYYNISNEEFRINSEYFGTSDSNSEALTYNCITADPEINTRLLQMKLRRTK